MPTPSTKAVNHIDLSRDQLIERAIIRQEGVMSANHAFSTTTGKRTGRSPKDRYIVRDALTESTVDWGVVNQPIEPEQFSLLWDRAVSYIAEHEHFTAHLQVGASPTHHVPVTVITETAWHNLFAHNLFIRSHDTSDTHPEWTVLNVANLATDPQQHGTHGDGAVIINFSQRKVLLSGMAYAGEMKKAMFSVLNFILPEHDILPMHCAANVGSEGDVALFFGLSGTGKTTLSADPQRKLIGDDEHGWSDKHVFNFEGGCYAKCIDLSHEREPVIWDAIRHGAIMENVVLDANTLQPDYTDVSLTQNSRAAYPREHIINRVEENYAGQPQAVIFLCCDLYGVLPPVALLTKEQAAYYFLSGYTALVGSTEVGQTEAVKPTFSTCFGAPFFPRPPKVYAELLMKRLAHADCDVYLVNTGWTSGAYGQGGKRFSIPTSRAIINAVFSGEVKQNATQTLPQFNIKIPTSLNNIESSLLDPRKNWSNQADYQQQQQQLVEKFIENMKRFDVSQAIVDAGPKLVGDNF